MRENKMKIALTADLHLTTSGNHPDRYHALENILLKLIEDQINFLIIAGDLFDSSSQNYSEFEALCKATKYKQIKFIVIPGNHDPNISNSAIVAENIHIFTEPGLVALDPEGPHFLFLPYQAGLTMGEKIDHFKGEFKPNDWILIGHGNWTESFREVNRYEPGVYMPLTRRDIEAYSPSQVFLGHIHKPYDQGRVHYIGSPCGLDITETGIRRFLVYDTVTGEIETKRVDTDVVYFDELLVVLPAEDERIYLEHAIKSRIEDWGIMRQDREKVRVRVRICGYSSDRKTLLKTIKTAFQGYSFYKDEEPDISMVSIADDPERTYIADKVRANLEELDWPMGLDEPDKEQIILAVLDVIYGD